MTIDWDDDEIRLGYKQPPPWGRFQKGRSGNPKGRPKQKTAPEPSAPIDSAADDVLRTELARKINVTDATGSRKLSAQELVTKSQMNQAIKGNALAQREILKQARSLEERDAARKAADEEKRRQMFQAFVDWRKEQKQAWAEAERQGVEPAELWPHPDDMHLDKMTGAWRIHGPSCADEAPRYKYLRAERDKAFVQAELARRDGAAAFSAHDVCRIIYNRLLPKRWRIQDDDDAWNTIAIRSTPRLQAELERLTELVEQLKKHARLPRRDKEEYRVINGALKPLLKAHGYRTLAQFERAQENGLAKQN